MQTWEDHHQERLQQKKKLCFVAVSRQEGFACSSRFLEVSGSTLCYNKASFKARAGCVGTVLLGFEYLQDGEAQPPWAAGASADHLGAKRFIWDTQADFLHCSLPLDLLLCTSGKGLASFSLRLFSRLSISSSPAVRPGQHLWCSPHCRSLEYNVGYNTAEQNL